MRSIIINFTVFFVILFLILSYIFVFVVYEDEEEQKKEETIKDNEPPTINLILGNTTGTTGKTTAITANFSDNVNVTKAILYYKAASDENWYNKSILSGSADIEISDKVEDWYYYITIDDAEGNGPIGDPSIDGSSYYIIKVQKDLDQLVHNVFIEVGTATWCPDCPPANEILQELDESFDYEFYYVNMIEDENSKAKSRLEDDYNIYGYPTVFIDGGYELIVDSTSNPKSVYQEKIENAMKRDAAKIEINVTSEYDNKSKEIKTTVIMTNYEEQKYTGYLKVYLAEIISHVQDNYGESYRNGFLDFIIDENIEIINDGEKSLTKIYNVSNYDVENLMIIAVVFNSESTEKYAYPSENENEFNAYYADASGATYIVQKRNLPPEVGITSIQKGKLYLFGKPLFYTILGNTILIGKAMITAQASDDSDISRVEFYIDDDLVANIAVEPYEWEWDEKIDSKLKNTIRIVAYDDEGKSSTASMEVIAFILKN